MYDAMPFDVARHILRAVREIRECAESGEHPAAAMRAARTAYSSGHRLPSNEDYDLLAGVVTRCEKAIRQYRHDQPGAGEMLSAIVADRRVSKLAARAKERVAKEECFC